ncbi:uncharacterized protein LOC110020276 [Phalaenopsis equestris]|uniref:uncharacterized protein LOC110020276 n=1 Tax=Phalaenopsis equestris TaxID=78828 RepID=UPI0009E2DD03|nr:uncharacterized protein LOC110020276 [Phalaenopsis equestris]
MSGSTSADLYLQLHAIAASGHCHCYLLPPPLITDHRLPWPPSVTAAITQPLPPVTSSLIVATITISDHCHSFHLLPPPLIIDHRLLWPPPTVTAIIIIANHCHQWPPLRSSPPSPSAATAITFTSYHHL